MVKWRLDRMRPLMMRRSIERGETITIQSIADQTGLHWATVQRYVSDDVRHPRVETLEQIARALGVETSYFVDIDDEGETLARQGKLQSGVKIA